MNIVDDFTTDPIWTNPGTVNAQLETYTAGGVTYNNINGITSVSASPSNDYVWGTDGTNPGSATSALLDSLFDTGTVGATSTVIYEFGTSLSADEQVVVFFNAAAGSFFQQAATIEAVDSMGNTVGSILDVSPTALTFGTTPQDALATANLNLFRPSGTAVLNDRLINGFSVDATAFGGTVTDIVGVRLTGHTVGGSIDSMDYQFIGRASAGPSLAEWDSTGGGSWGTAGNWDINEVPSGLPTRFGASITGPATVSLGTDRTARSLTFDNANSYTLSGGTLTVTDDIETLQGSHEIQSDLTLPLGTATLTSSAGASLNVTGTTSIQGDAAGTIVLDGAGGGSLGAISEGAEDNINVVKRGAGTWTIGTGSTLATDFHGGTTTIEEGTLRVAANSVGGTEGELRSSTIDVRAGGTLDTSEFSTYSLGVGQSLQGGGTIDAGTGVIRVFSDNNVTVGDGIGTLTVDGDLTLVGVEAFSPTGGFLFELSSSGAGTNDQVVVTGDLTNDGSSGTTRISVLPVDGGLDSSYELFTFGGSFTGDASDFQVDSSLTTRFTQSIVVDSDSVNLNITGSNAALTWNGTVGSNVWDVDSAPNWSGAGDMQFFDLDTVTFDDAAAEKNVDITETVTPTSVTINNSTGNDYTLSGTGGIAGIGSVTKTGTGRATISSDNTYSGVTTISGGVLHAESDTALGSSAAGTVVNGGALDFTNSNIAGETVSIQGAGSDGRGALMTDGVDDEGGGDQQIANVIQTGDATIAAYVDIPDLEFTATDYRWDLEPGGAAPTASWQGNGHNLTKKGRGTVSIQGVGDMNVASIAIEQGTLLWQGSTTAANATVTVGNGVDPNSGQAVLPGEVFDNGLASLSTFYSGATSGTPPAAHAINLVLQGGSYSHGTDNSTAVGISGAVTQNDVTGDDAIDNTINSGGNAATGALLPIQQGITGNGDIRFAGDGGVELQGDSTYTGRTEVIGNLLLTGSGSLSGTPSITVIGDGNLDVTGRTDGALTIGSGKRLISRIDIDDSGAGSVTGNVVVQSGGTLELNSGAGTVPAATNAFVQDTNTIGAANARYVAFEAENFTTYNDQSDFDWTVEEDEDALGGSAIVGTGTQEGFVGGDDDIAQYDIFFTEPGTYTWYVRTRADSDALDSFFGPSSNVDTGNQSGEPDGNFSAWIGNASLVNDSSGEQGIPTEYGWRRSDPSGDAGRVAFESITVTQEDVDNATVFSIGFEPRNLGATLDKMVLAATPAFTDLTDADLDAAVENATDFVQPPPPTFTFQIEGDLTLESGSMTEVDIRGLDDFDSADVTGTLDLDGSLLVNLDGFTPDLNDTFTILTAGTLVDSGLVLGGPDGDMFSFSTAGDELTLTYTGLVGLAGDYNSDGMVNAADYVAWRDGASPDSSQAGYDQWASNFGASNAPAVSGASVPEPTSVALLLIGFAGAALRARRCEA